MREPSATTSRPRTPTDTESGSLWHQLGPEDEQYLDPNDAEHFAANGPKTLDVIQDWDCRTLYTAHAEPWPKTHALETELRDT